jgi:nucleotide-binding universal stress UspA family protein
MIMKQHIVVGYDGSPAATAAVQWAADEAQRRDVDLELVHAYAIPVMYGAMGTGASPSTFEMVHDDAEFVAQEGRELVRTYAPDLRVHTKIAAGPPAAVLRELAQDAQLLVVGVSGHHALAGAVLGSVTSRLAGAVACPFVVVRPGVAAEDWDDLPVLVGLDGSAESEAALDLAFDMASRRGVPVLAVRVWDDTPIDGWSYTYALEVDRTATDARERKALHEQLDSWARKYPAVPVEPIVLRGHPAEALVRAGHLIERRPGLIVVGSRGRGGFTGLVLGSTSHGVIAHAECPVAVVHRPR